MTPPTPAPQSIQSVSILFRNQRRDLKGTKVSVRVCSSDHKDDAGKWYRGIIVSKPDANDHVTVRWNDEVGLTIAF